MEHEAPQRNHLFISYATENGDLAEWLALRLTTEGYRVWCDKTHLLGGESYPKDIDHAIKEHTFRLIALLSHASLAKPNPRKERTLGLSIARERNIDFLIPLNVDGLSATELDWMTSDLTFIPFHPSWADGFAKLLKKLGAIGTPRDVVAGRASVCDWMAMQATPARRSERLRANLLPVLELPKIIHKFEITERVILPKLAEYWPFYALHKSHSVWAFNAPPAELNVPVHQIASLSWQNNPKSDGLRIHDVAISTLRRAITILCLQRGMKLIPKSGSIYFPNGMFDQDHIRFTTYDGKRSYISANGQRTFRMGDQRETVRYCLAPSFCLTSKDFVEMAVRVSIQLHLTDLKGFPLEASKVISRRKRITKNWWNHEWLSRFLAVVEWLCNGQPECEVLRTASGAFRLSATPMMFSVDQGIDEENLLPAVEPERGALENEDDIDTFDAELDGYNEWRETDDE